MKRGWLIVVVACSACRPDAHRAHRTDDSSRKAAGIAADASTPRGTASDAAADVATAIETRPPQRDPDGNDDEGASEEVDVADRYDLERVGRPPLSLTRICDMRAHEGALYLAHAASPLGTDGATITTYRPDDATRPFRVAFDWNRAGEPTKGGGAGQGFVRIRRLEGRFVVPDADPPYDGFGVLDHGTEGYVFLSDAVGKFAPARQPHHVLPAQPKEPTAAGASVVPRAYHVIDAIRFRDRLYVSAGSVPPKERAWRGPAPGALHVASEDRKRFTYEVGFPFPYRDGVWRLTYLVRFRDRLYAGIQDYDGKSPWDYVYFAPSPDASAIRESDARPARVTDDGAATTYRWYADGGRLYWIAGGRDGVFVRVTSDGDTWSIIDLPRDVGWPTDIRRFGGARGALVVLTERALVRIDGDTPRVIGNVTEKKSPFAIDDSFCAAPLGVLGRELYAGGQKGGILYRWRAVAP